MGEVGKPSQYEDILADRRKGSDLRWAVREWQEDVLYKYQKKSSRSDFMNQVIKSDRVKWAIEKEVLNSGKSRKELEQKVSDILEEMCHNQNIGVIRKFAVPLSKIMKKIYGKIFVNSAAIDKIKKASSETPVIFLPTHRSYADFLLISYLAFHYHLSFPIIAAGMDFMSMAVIGDMLRGAGAFYIKRSFVNDVIYWAVFQEFVQRLICESGHPVEFFLEGTRSRTGKTLPPKLGLMSCVLECWLRGLVPDVAVVPISISYNRTLEEKLYAYEMLGVPKPKESTSGLLKAMKILKEDFGNIYVRIGDITYVSDYLAPRVHRHLNVAPSHAFCLSSQEFEACESFALHMSHQLQSNCVVSIWSVVCVVLLRTLWNGQSSVSLEALLHQVFTLTVLLKNLGAVVEGQLSKENIEANLRRGLNEHHETAVLSGNIVLIQQIHKPGFQDIQSSSKRVFLEKSTASVAVTHLVLQYYVNQLLHLIVRPSLVVMATPGTRDEIFARYRTLVSIFSFDFIFEKENLHKDFDVALSFLVENECASLSNDYVELVSGTHRPGLFIGNDSMAEFFTSIFHPFVLNYQVAFQVAGNRPLWESESAIVEVIQKAVETSAKGNRIYSALSLDACRQSTKMMIKLGALSTLKSEDGNFQLSSDANVISQLKDSLISIQINPTKPLLSKL